MTYFNRETSAIRPGLTYPGAYLIFLPVVVEAMDEIDAEWKFLDAIEPYISDAVIHVYLKGLRVS